MSITNRIASFALLAALTAGAVGCVSQTMQSFEDNDIRQVLDYYGPPDTAFDTEDGYRAFEWHVKDPYISPPMSLTEHQARAYDTSPWFNPEVPLVRGALERHYCVYTMMARYNAEAKAWFVRRYVAPTIDCVEKPDA